MRARPREAADDGGERQPKALPKPLARQVESKIATETAMRMAEDREASGVEPSSSTQPPMLGIMTDHIYFLSAVPVAQFFGIMLVPRAPVAFENYRWDQVMQGAGPESLVVQNCRNLLKLYFSRN